MVTGVVFAVALCFRPDLISYFVPIVGPLLLAAPLAVWTSRRASGEAFARRGYLVTPAMDTTANPASLPASRPIEMTRPMVMAMRSA
ncbi:MAG: hypothetical protein EON48_18185 [Acetobacteraceae bacterium]|nr:MAG: hypothetical protein EON48_18185 [Acetobacteraceae bacterium]